MLTLCPPHLHSISNCVLLQFKNKKTKRKKYKSHKLCPTALFKANGKYKIWNPQRIVCTRNKNGPYQSLSREIEKCNKCQCEMDNENLFKSTRRNPNDKSYNHILNWTIIEQRNALNYIKEIQTEYLVLNI